MTSSPGVDIFNSLVTLVSLDRSLSKGGELRHYFPNDRNISGKRSAIWSTEMAPIWIFQCHHPMRSSLWQFGLHRWPGTILLAFHCFKGDHVPFLCPKMGTVPSGVDHFIGVPWCRNPASRAQICVHPTKRTTCFRYFRFSPHLSYPTRFSTEPQKVSFLLRESTSKCVQTHLIVGLCWFSGSNMEQQGQNKLKPVSLQSSEACHGSPLLAWNSSFLTGNDLPLWFPMVSSIPGRKISQKCLWPPNQLAELKLERKLAFEN